MRLTVIAVGTRMPSWADEAFHDYARRMPRTAALELLEVRPEARTGKPVAALLAAEAARIRAAVPKGANVVLLDERGSDLTTRALAARLGSWLESGREVALILGGPDGVDPALKSAAAETIKLSSLTLPHALARVLLAEALYRAWTMLNNHPYHRE